MTVQIKPEFRTLFHLFGISAVTSVIWNNMLPQYIRTPSEQDSYLRVLRQNFNSVEGLLMELIGILVLLDSTTDITKKSFYSVILRGVVDH